MGVHFILKSCAVIGLLFAISYDVEARALEDSLEVFDFYTMENTHINDPSNLKYVVDSDEDNMHSVISEGESETIVLFGANRPNVDFLAGLLSFGSNSNLYVRHGDTSDVVVDPGIDHWEPLDKYHRNYGTQPNDILSNLNKLSKPMKFVVTVSYDDLFRDEFWTLVGFMAEDKTYHNEIVFVALHMPYDMGTLDQHVNEIKQMIQNADQKGQLGPFEVRGIHEIKESGKISEIPNLTQELTAVKSIVDPKTT